jgi:nickel transport protein
MLTILLVALVSPIAQAHLLKVFAFAEGNHITGTTYFVGGAPAAGASVRVMNTDGQLLDSLTPDAEGKFSYRATTEEDHVIVADTGDGHLAKWLVTAAELTGDEALSSHQDSAFPATPVNAREPDHSELSAMVEAAVARQVRPLREQIIAYEESVRLQDIVGGIGYIFGIFGLVAWWHQKRGAGS